MHVRLLLALLGLGFVAAIAGCESVTEHVRERFEPAQPQVRAYTADRETVFNAAKEALKMLDFQVTRARMNEGILRAHSRIIAGDAFSDARQYTFDVGVTLNDAGQVEVAAQLRQQDESGSYAGATNIPLKQHGLYDSFFAALEGKLKVAGVRK